MDLQNISLQPLGERTVAILGYGNQGRAHALNLRESGLRVVVGAREGRGRDTAVVDGFEPMTIPGAVDAADVVLFLFPDEIIPTVYSEVESKLPGKTVGFAHGFAYHFQLIRRVPTCGYFLVGPKGAGAILRDAFTSGEGLPGVFAAVEVPGATEAPTREIALAYAKGIGCASKCLLETSFAEETECDLFGEQAVLCGGIMQLMEGAFQTLTRNGLSEEMAFFECCFEARMILELWMKYGPAELSRRISPTAFFGGLTRGRRLVTDETRQEMEKIFKQIRSGEFAREWMEEVRNGKPGLKAERERLGSLALERVYQKLIPALRGAQSRSSG